MLIYRGNLAAFYFDGNVMPWEPRLLGGGARALACLDGVFYAGTQFQQVRINESTIVTRWGMAAFDELEGLTDWESGPGVSSVSSIQVKNQELYVSGAFRRIGLATLGGCV